MGNQGALAQGEGESESGNGPGRLAARGAVFALWLTAALAVGAYASGDRYPGYFIAWSFVLVAAGLVAPLAALGAVAARLPRRAPAGRLASAFCVLFAGALSLDVNPTLVGAPILGTARLLLLGFAVAFAAWSAWRARASRLSLGTAMLVVSMAWVLCGLLRAEGAPEAFAVRSVLAPLFAAVVVLVPGVPRLEPVLSRSYWWPTLGAVALLAWLPLSPRDMFPALAASAPEDKAPRGRSAVLIVLDTLRRDHMSLYGYARPTTPAIDARAAGGVVFDDATSVSSWTFPSHASMFTGLWPRSHGGVKSGFPLAPERVTLAEIARDGGYRTAGLVSNHAFLSPSFGIHQGFQDYLCRRPVMPRVMLRTARALALRWDGRHSQLELMPYFTAPEMTRAAISWLERQRETPFFLFLNYMDVHVPNAAPGSQGLPFEDEEPLTAAHWDRLYLEPISAAVRRGLVNEYDRELIYLDRSVGVLLEYLERSGLAERTLVILTSDHGEFLGEHELIGHNQDLYAEVVDVPLVMWEPGRKPSRVSRPVQVLDVFPTILGYLGLPVPEGTQGQPLMSSDHSIVSELHAAPASLLRTPGGHRFDRILRTIRTGEFRYFRGSNGEERLIRLAEPGETANLLPGRPQWVESARAQLDEWLLRTPEVALPTVEAKPDAKTLENLRSLGYVR